MWKVNYICSGSRNSCWLGRRLRCVQVISYLVLEEVLAQSHLVTSHRRATTFAYSGAQGFGLMSRSWGGGWQGDWGGWTSGWGSGWGGTGWGGGSGSGACSGGGGGGGGGGGSDGGGRPRWEKHADFKDDSTKWVYSEDPNAWAKDGVNLFLDPGGGGATTGEALAAFDWDACHKVLPAVSDIEDKVKKGDWDPSRAPTAQMELLDFLPILGVTDKFQEVQKTAIRRKGQKNAS